MFKPILPPRREEASFVPRQSHNQNPYRITDPSISAVTDFFYRGNEEAAGVVTGLERFLNSGDVNHDGGVNNHDSGIPEWLDVEISAVRQGFRAHIERYVRAYDSDGNGQINQTEYQAAMAGFQKIEQRWPQFGDGYHFLTEARYNNNPQHRVTTEKLIETFGEMLDHGLPDAIQATPPTRQR